MSQDLITLFTITCPRGESLCRIIRRQIALAVLSERDASLFQVISRLQDLDTAQRSNYSQGPYQWNPGQVGKHDW